MGESRAHRVLTVEDSVLQRAVLRRALVNGGYEVVETGDGVEALAQLEAGSFDIIISDVEMPNMDGYQLCEAIKKNADYRNIPLVLVTSLSSPQDLIRGIVVEADTYITKPYEPQRLLAHVQNLLKSTPRQASASERREVTFAGAAYKIPADPHYTLNFLLATYENIAEQREQLNLANEKLRETNEELHRAEERLKGLNAELEDRVVERTAELERARRRAEETSQEKSEFLAGLNHALRSPLNGILGFTQLLGANDSLSDAQRRYVTQILDASAHMRDLMNDTLDFARVEVGRLAMSPARSNPATLVGHTLDSLKPEAKALDVTLSFSEPPEPAFITVDGERFGQALGILVQNALRRSPSQKSVTVSMEDGSYGHLRINVRDDGEHIPSELREELFHPFSRSARMGTEDATGMELAICKHIVTLMDGTLGLESPTSGGACFFVEFQRESLPEDEESDTFIEVGSGVAKSSIVYVGSSEGDSVLLEEVVALRPNLRFCASSEAAEVIRSAAERRPIMIIVGLDDDDSDGRGIVDALTSSQDTKGIPLAILADDDIASRFGASVIDSFDRRFTKPLDVQQVLDALDAYVESSAPLSPQSKGAPANANTE